MIEWGGEIVNSEFDGQHSTTQMGSGHFPEEGFGKAGYFKNIQIVDGSNNLRPPKDLNTFTEQSNCYNVGNDNDGDWGNYFFYGGPGRNPNCPWSYRENKIELINKDVNSCLNSREAKIALMYIFYSSILYNIYYSS